MPPAKSCGESSWPGDSDSWYSIKRIASSSLSCRRAKARTQEPQGHVQRQLRNVRPHFPSRERHIQQCQGDEAHVMVPTPPGPRFVIRHPQVHLAVLEPLPLRQQRAAGHRRAAATAFPRWRWKRRTSARSSPANGERARGSAARPCSAASPICAGRRTRTPADPWTPRAVSAGARPLGKLCRKLADLTHLGILIAA